jgi:hypothetical protein
VAVALWSATATGSNGEGLVPNRVSLLAPSLGEPRDPWVMVTGAVTAGQAAWLLGLAVAGFVLVAARSRIAKLGSVLPLAVGLLIALPLFPASAAATYVPDAAAKALVCTGSVCVTALHETRLPELVGPGTEALRKLEALPGTPARVEETATVEPVDGDRERSATAVLVDFETAPYRDARGEDLVRSMVAGAGTTPCKGLRHGDDEYVREQVARSVSAAWFMGEVKPLPGFRFLQDKVDQQIRPVWDAFRALPAAEQQARISALRAAALSCRGDLLDVLTHGGAR